MKRDRIPPFLALVACAAFVLGLSHGHSRAPATALSSPRDAAPAAPAWGSALPFEQEELRRLERVEQAAARRLARQGVERPDELGRALVNEALAAGLDPVLVLAMVHVESSFRIDARSHVGAVGLLQVMPATGADVARREGIHWRGERTLLDPADNVRIGVTYMAELIEIFDGDIDRALVAYNRGPTSVRRLLSRGRSLPMEYADKVREQSRRMEAEVTLTVAALAPDAGPSHS